MSALPLNRVQDISFGATHNAATGACCSWQKGAGVYDDVGGDATLADSNVYQNEALDKGGGLFIRGTAALTNVNVYGNRAEIVCASPFELCLGTLSPGHNIKSYTMGI